MTRILIRAGRSPFEPADPARVLQQNLIASNTGNLLFSDAIWKFLSTPGTEITPNRYRVDPGEADRINEEFDAFLVPLANAFRPNFKHHLDDLSALIEKLTIPVVVFGVGAQSGVEYSTEHMAPIEDQVRRFCSAVLDRSASIGVRGEFTESYLKGLGFDDVEVIGCPSMFTHGLDLWVDRGPDELTASSRLAVNISYASGNIPGSEITDGTINRLVEAALDRYPDQLYFGQERRDLELLYWGDVSREADEHSDEPLKRSHRLLSENRTHLYYDTRRWIEVLRERDFAFGTRIHGNIAALLAGTPAVVLCHDSRTLELCRYLEIPHRLVRDLREEDLGGLPARLYQEADFSRMISGHEERFDRVLSFMDRNGLEHVYGPEGDGGSAFEAELKRTPQHPGVTAWHGEDDGGLGYRTAWLRTALLQERAKRSGADKKIRELTRSLEQRKRTADTLAKELARTTRRLDALERRMNTTP